MCTRIGWAVHQGLLVSCRVIAWEPVPLFRDFFKFGIAVNGFQQLITVGSTGFKRMTAVLNQWCLLCTRQQQRSDARSHDE